MQPVERFETPRLTLRPVGTGDAQALFDAYASDPQATTYLSWRTHETVDETTGFLEEAEAGWDGGREFIWAIVTRDDGRPVGAISATDTAHGVEIGYVLARPLWGKGLVSEALAALMRWLQGERSVYRVWAYCAVGHQRSARVLERSGMTYEGTLRRWVVLPNLAAEPCDAQVYSWVREDA